MTSEIEELDRVRLRVDKPSRALKAGRLGTVVHRYPDGRAFEVEFPTGNAGGVVNDLVDCTAAELEPA